MTKYNPALAILARVSLKGPEEKVLTFDSSNEQSLTKRLWLIQIEIAGPWDEKRSKLK